MFFDLLIAFIIALTVTYILVPTSMSLAHKIGAIDVPKDDRRMHKKPIPRFGGFAVVIGFVAGFAYFLFKAHINGNIALLGPEGYGIKIIGYLIGVFILCAFNIYDDKVGLRPIVKLIGQVLAASVVIACGVRIDVIDENELASVIQIIFTLIWIVAITNAINFIDGLDGLSSGITMISSFALLTIFVLNNSPIIAIIITAALAGSLAGFLPYNFHPAKTFIGDIGSNFMGYTLAVVSILGVAKTATTIVVVLPFLVLGIPIFDIFSAVIRRIKKEKSIKAIFKADRGHIHHRLIDMGLSQTQAVVLLYFITAACGMFSIVLYVYGRWKALIFALFVFILLLVWYIRFKKNRHFEKNDEK